MDKETKFVLPKPDFSKKDTKTPKSIPHYLTPSGMTLLPRDKQPPPMYGPKGSTIPPRFLVQPKQCQTEQLQERHFCEPCEMELQTTDDFRRHRAQHERCPVDGCKFKAHASVMDKHVMELHASGIFDKIKKITTPEEIAAWREERRKKYPTLANAQMLKLAKEQRQRRGERLQVNNSRFGRHEDKKRARNVERRDDKSSQVPKKSHVKTKPKHKKRNRTINKPVVGEEPMSVKGPEPLGTGEENFSEGMRMFEGTSKMRDYKHEKTKKKQSENVLAGLLGMYGSDNEDDDATSGEEESDSGKIVEEKQIATTEQNMLINLQNSQSDDVEMIEIYPSDRETSNKSTAQSSFQESETAFGHAEAKRSTTIEAASSSPHQTDSVLLDIIEDKNPKESSDEAPEEAPIERTTSVPYIQSTKSNSIDCGKTVPKDCKLEKLKKAVQEKRKYGLNYRKVRLRKQNTMLEKLLEPDIRHERNLLLQCVRFVCQNDFFGIGKKDTLNDNTK